MHFCRRCLSKGLYRDLARVKEQSEHMDAKALHVTIKGWE